MSWTSLNFGKHKGKTLPQVMFNDPDWFFWAFEVRVFEQGGLLKSEAARIHAKATSIRIPQVGSEQLQVEYTFYYSNHTSVGFEVVEKSRPPHDGSSPTVRSARALNTLSSSATIPLHYATNRLHVNRDLLVFALSLSIY